MGRFRVHHLFNDNTPLSLTCRNLGLCIADEQPTCDVHCAAAIAACRANADCKANFVCLDVPLSAPDAGCGRECLTQCAHHLATPQGVALFESAAECIVDDCIPGTTVPEFICACPSGWTGDVCEVNVDECDLGPCKNNGTCVDSVNGYRCVCPHEYGGSECQNRRSCADTPCLETGSSCANVMGYPPQADCLEFCAEAYQTCEATPGCNDECLYVPIFGAPGQCDAECVLGCARPPTPLSTVALTDAIDCIFNQCPAFGSSPVVTGFACNCTRGFTGKVCEVNIDDCALQPCSNGATCVDGIASRYCNCRPGFFGDSCNTACGACAAGTFVSRSCFNLTQTTCTPVSNCTATEFLVRNATVTTDRVCQSCRVCPNGTIEDRPCNATHDGSCKPCPCRHGGKCVEVSGGPEGKVYGCQCSPGFDGYFCEKKLTCAARACANNATCLAGPPSCTSHCAHELAECQANADCAASALCLYVPLDPRSADCDRTCVMECARGTVTSTGIALLEAGAGCILDGCIGGETTRNFTCNCTAGFTGDLCDVDVQECASNPCLNGGTCADRVNGYQCICPRTHTGTNCETVLTCAHQPCNDGACTDIFGPPFPGCEEFCKDTFAACEADSDCAQNRLCLQVCVSVGGGGGRGYADVGWAPSRYASRFAHVLIVIHW